MRQFQESKYYLRRYDEEMRLAGRAESATVASIHFELAHRYALSAAKVDAEQAMAKFGTPNGQLAA